MADLNRLNAMDQAERWLSYLTHDPMPDEETQGVFAATAQAWTLVAIFDVLKEMNASLKQIQTPKALRARNANIGSVVSAEGIYRRSVVEQNPSLDRASGLERRQLLTTLEVPQGTECVYAQLLDERKAFLRRKLASPYLSTQRRVIDLRELGGCPSAGAGGSQSRSSRRFAVNFDGIGMSKFSSTIATVLRRLPGDLRGRS